MCQKRSQLNSINTRRNNQEFKKIIIHQLKEQIEGGILGYEIFPPVKCDGA